MTHSERQHTKISPSGATRWINCPGSVILSATAPPQPESPFANEGSRAHELAEYCLEHRVSDPHSVKSGFDDIPDLQKDAVRTYVDYTLPKLLTSDYCGIEDQVQLTLGDTVIKGIVDFWYVTGDRLEIVDYKHGQGVVVEPRGNYQLVLYAHGVLSMLSKSVQSAIKDIVVTIVQPRAPHADGPIRSWQVDPKEFIEILATAISSVKRVESGDETLNPGAWCRFCPALPVCPAVAEQAKQKAREEFADCKLLSIEEVAALLKWAEDVLIPWASSMRGYLFDEIDRGQDVPGWKIVEKRAVRKWVSEDAVLDWARKMRLRQADIFERRLINPAQMEKLVGRKKIPADLIDKHSSGRTLVRETDPRSDASSSAAGEEFLEENE